MRWGIPGSFSHTPSFVKKPTSSPPLHLQTTVPSSDCAHIIKRLYNGGDPADVPNSGPAPAILRFADLEAVTPYYEKVTAAIEEDEEAKKVLGESDGGCRWAGLGTFSLMLI